MQVVCTSDSCEFIISSKCVFYEGATLPYTGIATNSTLEQALQDIEDTIASIGGGGSAVWGDITGNIANQTDLISYLSGNYVPLARTLTINGQVFDLSANRTWTISTGHTIENSGTPLPTRANLNFTNGLTASDSDPDTLVKLGGLISDLQTFVDIGDYDFSNERLLAFRIYALGDPTSYSGLILDSEFGGISAKLIGQGTPDAFNLLYVNPSVGLFYSISEDQSFGLSFGGLIATFDDNRTVKVGLQYLDEAYGSGFTNSTLIHRAYADARYWNVTGDTTVSGTYSSNGSTMRFGLSSVVTLNNAFLLFQNEATNNRAATLRSVSNGVNNSATLSVKTNSDTDVSIASLYVGETILPNRKGLFIASDTTGIEILDEAGTTGMYYAADYSTNGVANRGDRWIPDKGFTDGAYWKVAGTSTLEAASILVTQDNLLELSTDPLSATDPYIGIRFFPDTGFGYSAQFETRPLANVSTSFAHVNLEGNIMSLVSTTSTDSKQLTLSPTDAIFTDGSVNKKGVQYASSAYGAAFTDETLIHRLYADGRYAPIGSSSSGANNEVQTSDGAGGFVGSKAFIDESTANLTLGDTGLAGSSRTIGVSGSDGVIGLNLFTKSTGNFFFATSSGTGGITANMEVDLGDLFNNNVLFEAVPPAGDNNGKGFVFKGSQALDTNHGGCISLIPGDDSGSGMHGNINLGSTTIPSWQGMERGIFIVNRVADPSAAIVDGIALLSKDSSDGSANSTLALFTEQAPEATATFTQTHRIKIWWNNTEYYLSLDQV